jgi:hypothetical protein
MARTRPPQERRILCTACGGLLIVAREAKSVSCKHCNGRVICERIEVKDFVAVRRFRTANAMHIKKRGRVHASVWAEELRIDGLLMGDAAAVGTIRIGRHAKVTGRLRATALEVELGATLVGDMRIGPEHVPEREALAQSVPGEVMDEMEARWQGPRR